MKIKEAVASARAALSSIADWLDGKKTYICTALSAAFTIWRDWGHLDRATLVSVALDGLIALARLSAKPKTACPTPPNGAP